jgi:hypothetical protein
MNVTSSFVSISLPVPWYRAARRSARTRCAAQTWAARPHACGGMSGGGLARVDPTTQRSLFGADHQTRPHLALPVPHDGSLALRAAEIATAILCSGPAILLEERRGLGLSPPNRSRTRPHPVPSDTAWPASDLGPVLHVCHHHLLNAYVFQDENRITRVHRVPLGPVIRRLLRRNQHPPQRRPRHEPAPTPSPWLGDD